MIVAFVDENRDQFGVEFICRQLQVAPSSYYAAKHREAAPSARAVRDAVMMQVLLALWVAIKKVYGRTSSGRPPAGPGTTSAATGSPG